MIRTARRTLATLGAAALTMGAMATTAQAGPNDSAKGTVTSPGVEMTFDAKSDANGTPSGTFQGAVKVGSFGLVRATGPVTCLEVEGNKVGFFYPMTETSPSFMENLNLGVYMNMTVENGQAKSISYSVVPKQTGGCKPAPTFLPASGAVETNGG